MSLAPAQSARSAVSNASSVALTVWLEPWCDELSLPPRSCVTVCPVPPDGVRAVLPEFEVRDDVLVVWAACPGTMIVEIDGVIQDTGSQTIDLPPAMFGMPVKDVVDMAFGPFPEARPGGAALPAKRSFWQRLLGR